MTSRLIHEQTYRTRAKTDASHVKRRSLRDDRKRMAVHVVCPSLRCRKILTLADDVRGTNVTCRYCQMQVRVPALRRAADARRAAAMATPNAPGNAAK